MLINLDQAIKDAKSHQQELEQELQRLGDELKWMEDRFIQTKSAEARFERLDQVVEKRAEVNETRKMVDIEKIKIQNLELERAEALER